MLAILAALISVLLLEAFEVLSLWSSVLITCPYVPNAQDQKRASTPCRAWQADLPPLASGCWSASFAIPLSQVSQANVFNYLYYALLVLLVNEQIWIASQPFKEKATYVSQAKPRYT
jgi:hypothetical protein